MAAPIPPTLPGTNDAPLGAPPPWLEGIHRALQAASGAFAIGAGLLLTAIVILSVVSIVGRKLFSAPIPGDLELLQMGIAISASWMLAYCEMALKHLKVDFFSLWMTPLTQRRLDALAHLLLGLVALLIAARTASAALSTYHAAETTMVLAIPMWPGVALVVPGFVLLGLAGLYNALALWITSHDRGGK